MPSKWNELRQDVQKSRQTEADEANYFLLANPFHSNQVASDAKPLQLDTLPNIRPDDENSWNALTQSGLSKIFVRHIAEIAAYRKLIICIRTMSCLYKQLLEFEYTTKSMAIHAKTCSWGPMTGFVSIDPNLHKHHCMSRTAQAQQIKYLNEFLNLPKDKKKQFIPLLIPLKRIKYLYKKGLIALNHSDESIFSTSELSAFDIYADCPSLDMDSHTYETIDFDHRSHRCLNRILFRLIRCNNLKYYPKGTQLTSLIADARLYFVCIKTDVSSVLSCQTIQANPTYHDQLFTFLNYWMQTNEQKQMLSALRTQLFNYFSDAPNNSILAYVDPCSPYNHLDYRNATTGDYDLFSIHPLKDEYFSKDSHKLMKKFTCDIHTSMGRISPFEIEIIQLLNAHIARRTGHHVQLFHHGAEAHNPYSKRPDFPFISILPCQQGSPFFEVLHVSNIREINRFYMKIAQQGYAITPGLNESWRYILTHFHESENVSQRRYVPELTYRNPKEFFLEHDHCHSVFRIPSRFGDNRLDSARLYTNLQDASKKCAQDSASLMSMLIKAQNHRQKKDPLRDPDMLCAISVQDLVMQERKTLDNKHA